MAIKALMLKRKLELRKASLAELEAKDEEFAKREKELEESINEAVADDEQKAVEEEVEKLDKEKKEHEDAKEVLKNEIDGIEKELAEIEKPVEVEDEGEEKENEDVNVNVDNEERKGDVNMTRRNAFSGMSVRERNDMLKRKEVVDFLQNVRVCIKEKRALTNVGLTIPDVMLPLIRELVYGSSKLMRFVTVRNVGGTSRQNIMGSIPEAYWDEMCASLKELDLTFYNTELDGYKVSGYYAVCNAILEDSDLDLANELLAAIAEAIAKALDKAIVYGTGTKMPMGIVTSLLLATAPTGYPATGRAWEDLSATHVITGATASGAKLFADIVKACKVIHNNYNNSGIVWLMNNATHMDILAESIGSNSSAAIVAGMGNTMPIVGGEIVELDYIPDGTVIFGYFPNYTLAQRAGIQLAQSEHVRFIEDQTVFKGTARYDGEPTIREAFAIYGIGKAPDTTSPSFPGFDTEATA